MAQSFESLVNSVRCKTLLFGMVLLPLFESLVNSVRCKTIFVSHKHPPLFESLVNLFIEKVYRGMLARFRHIFPFAT